MISHTLFFQIQYGDFQKLSFILKKIHSIEKVSFAAIICVEYASLVRDTTPPCGCFTAAIRRFCVSIALWQFHNNLRRGAVASNSSVKSTGQLSLGHIYPTQWLPYGVRGFRMATLQFCHTAKFKAIPCERRWTDFSRQYLISIKF